MSQMTHEEIQALKKEIFAEADERFVKIVDCNETQSKNENKHFVIEKKADSNTERISRHDKIFWLIASGMIGYFVVAFLDLLLKK
jgi:hypothetical protein